MNARVDANYAAVHTYVRYARTQSINYTYTSYHKTRLLWPAAYQSPLKAKKPNTTQHNTKKNLFDEKQQNRRL